MAAVASHDVELLDLVSFGHTLRHHGLVVAHVVEADDHDSADIGTFRLLLADNTVVYKNAGDLRVVDRSHLQPGQVVGSASGDDGQLGVVTGVTTVLDLAKHDSRLGEIHVIPGVSPSALRRVRSFNLGDFVVSGPWLGQVVEVSIDVDVMFDDGAICRVTNADSNKLKQVDDPVAGSNTFFYRHQMNALFDPGELVTAPDPGSLFKGARWLNGSWNPDHKFGTVTKVETSGVHVCWIASMHHGTDKGLVKASAPSAYQNPNDLTFFSAASNCSWGVADRCFFRNGNVTDDDESEAPTAQAGVGIPMVVANTRTSVDVLWQDGTLQRGISSATVVPSELVDEELFPGDHVVGVLPIDATGDYGTELARPVGVIRSLHYGDRTACVSWLNEAREDVCDDTVTVYALKSDPSYPSADYGDIVIRLLPSGSTSGEITPLLQGNKKNNAVAADLSWVGRVVDILYDGHVQVKWGDGTMSMVLPHEIVVVEEERYWDLLDKMHDWVVVDNIVDAPEELAAANTHTDHDIQNPTDDNSTVEDDNPTTKRTGILGLATQSLLQMTNGVVARCKGYMQLSSSTSSKLPKPTYEDTTETIDAAMTRNIVNVNGHNLAEEGAKADD
ncbi:putative ubiquitin carrier protein E2 23 [Hordeum vulgare]|nr:putative ubiquitin carrier protein E2 23 [Hordeum vulgare]